MFRYFENRKTTYFDVFCLNFSIETKIKTLFLISYFNLSKTKKKTKWHFVYTDCFRLSMLEETSENDLALIVNLQTYEGLPKVPIYKNEPRFQD